VNVVFNPTLMGKRIASGGDRRVYRYGTDQVVKISSLYFLTGDKLHKKLARDYGTCRFYMPEFVVETHDVTQGGGKHIEIQPFIKGEPLSRKHCSRPEVRAQLQRITEIADRMEADGHPLIDLVGHHGMIGNMLANILVDDNHRLHIVDTTLLEGKSLGAIGVILDIIAPLIRMKQNYLLKKFLR
jgi:hypothetical protein